MSVQFQNLLRMDLLQPISLDFPYELFSSLKIDDGLHKRDRVYTDENTLLTMLITAAQQDKSLQHSVNIFSNVFEARSIQIQQLEAEQMAVQQQSDNVQKRRGRPRLYRSKLPKSTIKPLSTNTAAFAKARRRLSHNAVEAVFNYSKNFDSLPQFLWHGLRSFNTDGTYIQMQDSEELRKKYYVKPGDGAYPQALLQAIVCQGSGQITDFTIGTRHQSELELIAGLVAGLPVGSLLLADDLYSSYAIFSLLQSQKHHLIVPGKRDRNYTVIQTIAAGDEIVQLQRTSQPKWWKEQWQMPETLLMRRLSYLSPVDGQTACILYTTLLDPGITKSDIIVKYSSRWDIEITIREIKTLMDINVARSKTEDMVLKEITVALSAYNIIRKIIAQSVEQTELSPPANIFQKLAENYKGVLMDKKGRVYQRWSPGRYGKAAIPN